MRLITREYGISNWTTTTGTRSDISSTMSTSVTASGASAGSLDSETEWDVPSDLEEAPVNGYFISGGDLEESADETENS